MRLVPEMASPPKMHLPRSSRPFALHPRARPFYRSSLLRRAPAWCRALASRSRALRSARPCAQAHRVAARPPRGHRLLHSLGLVGLDSYYLTTCTGLACVLRAPAPVPLPVRAPSSRARRAPCAAAAQDTRPRPLRRGLLFLHVLGFWPARHSSPFFLAQSHEARGSDPNARSSLSCLAR